MALKKQFVFRGLTAVDGYHRVTNLAINVDGKRVDVGVRSYASAAERQANPGSPLMDSSHSIADLPARTASVSKEDGTVQVVEVAPARPGWTNFNADLAAGKNPIQAAYAWLKLYAFPNSEDV